jgi:phosphoglycolate phosphatase
MTDTVFFDLDGTLTDSKPGIVRSLRYAVGRMDCDLREDDDLDWCIGPPLLATFERLVGPERAHEALDHYRERFGTIGWRENALYPGVKDGLRRLAESGSRLLVATSKPQIFADRILCHFDLSRYFSGVFGSELDGTRSRKTELLRFAVAQSNVTGSVIMVGDRHHDVDGAKANGLHSIGVTYGYGDRRELESAGASYIVDTVDELFLALDDKDAVFKNT